MHLSVVVDAFTYEKKYIYIYTYKHITSHIAHIAHKICAKSFPKYVQNPGINAHNVYLTFYFQVLLYGPGPGHTKKRQRYTTQS